VSSTMFWIECGTLATSKESLRDIESLMLIGNVISLVR
jgi:hypothetical protein